MNHHQFLYEALPTSGEVEYETFYNQMQETAEGRKALSQLQHAKRVGAVKTRLESVDGVLKHYISRGDTTPEGSA